MPENSCDIVYFLVLDLFYCFTVVYQWFISKKTIIFQGFRGSPTFSREGSLFSMGGGGVQLFPGGGLNANLYSNQLYLSFSRGGGGRDPLSPSGTILGIKYLE